MWIFSQNLNPDQNLHCRAAKNYFGWMCVYCSYYVLRLCIDELAYTVCAITHYSIYSLSWNVRIYCQMKLPKSNETVQTPKKNIALSIAFEHILDLNSLSLSLSLRLAIYEIVWIACCVYYNIIYQDTVFRGNEEGGRRRSRGIRKNENLSLKEVTIIDLSQVTCNIMPINQALWTNWTVCVCAQGMAKQREKNTPKGPHSFPERERDGDGSVYLALYRINM